MGILKHVITIVLIPVVIVLLYLGYKWWNTPPKTEFTYPTLTAVQRSIDKSLDGVADVPEPRKVIIVEPVLNDSEAGEALNYFVMRLGASPRFTLLPQRVKVVDRAESQGILDWLKEKILGKDEEKQYLDLQGFDGYLVLDLNRAEDNEKAWASAALRFIPKGKGAGDAVMLGKAKEEYPKSYANYDYLSHSIQGTSWFGRLFIWIIIALAVPWASYPVAMRVLAMNSNRANVAMIAGLALVSFVSGFILMGLTFGGFLWFLGLLVMTGLAAFWATAVLMRFEEMQKG
ncbi:MAG: hypothetical protein E3J72_21100 [Planctomycetota bacterium]|nr:MAG: hypothetical protein E3J72_21100 [Planctomycetota bacterium]